MSPSWNAIDSIVPKKTAASSAIPSWLTDAAARINLAARSGSPGADIENPSINICAPICDGSQGPLIL